MTRLRRSLEACLRKLLSNMTAALYQNNSTLENDKESPINFSYCKNSRHKAHRMIENQNEISPWLEESSRSPCRIHLLKRKCKTCTCNWRILSGFLRVTLETKDDNQYML